MKALFPRLPIQPLQERPLTQSISKGKISTTVANLIPRKADECRLSLIPEVLPSIYLHYQTLSPLPYPLDRHPVPWWTIRTPSCPVLPVYCVHFHSSFVAVDLLSFRFVRHSRFVLVRINTAWD